MIGGEPRVAAAGRVFEDDVRDFADQIGDQPAHDGGGEGKVLLEWSEEIEGQRLTGKQVVPRPFDVDDGADFAVGDLVLDEGDQGWVDQVDAALADAVGDHAAEAAACGRWGGRNGRRR